MICLSATISDVISAFLKLPPHVIVGYVLLTIFFVIPALIVAGILIYTSQDIIYVKRRVWGMDNKRQVKAEEAMKEKEAPGSKEENPYSMYSCSRDAEESAHTLSRGAPRKHAAESAHTIRCEAPRKHTAETQDWEINP